jgi:hypothetical protein
LFGFLWFDRADYREVLVHMEPLYLIVAGWWWRLTGRRVWLWYNHVFHDWRLRLGAPFAQTIVGVSPAGIPVRHSDIQYVQYEKDLVAILTGISDTPQ